MIRRARSLAVVAILGAGIVCLIASTQTWVHVVLAAGAAADVAVSGAAAVPVLAPLSLAVLALGAALSIVGRVLRYAFGVLTVLAAAALGTLGLQVVAGPPVSSYGPGVTETTGITGDAAIGALVDATALTPWPAVAVAASIVLLAAGVFVLVTARSWRAGARRYETAAQRAAAAPAGPLDAVDSWDDLSRGSDPTTPGEAR